jgi:hypothetical protein
MIGSWFTAAGHDHGVILPAPMPFTVTVLLFTDIFARFAILHCYYTTHGYTFG